MRLTRSILKLRVPLLFMLLSRGVSRQLLSSEEGSGSQLEISVLPTGLADYIRGCKFLIVD